MLDYNVYNHPTLDDIETGVLLYCKDYKGWGLVTKKYTKDFDGVDYFCIHWFDKNIQINVEDFYKALKDITRISNSCGFNHLDINYKRFTDWKPKEFLINELVKVLYL